MDTGIRPQHCFTIRHRSSPSFKGIRYSTSRFSRFFVHMWSGSEPAAHTGRSAHISPPSPRCFVICTHLVQCSEHVLCAQHQVCANDEHCGLGGDMWPWRNSSTTPRAELNVRRTLFFLHPDRFRPVSLLNFLCCENAAFPYLHLRDGRASR